MLTTIHRPNGRLVRSRVYTPTGSVGRKLQRAADLQARIALLDAELRSLREEILHHMESKGLDRMEVGDFRATRKTRHAWTYSASTEREMLALRQLQKWEQAQGIATDNPTIHVALSTTSSPENANP